MDTRQKLNGIEKVLRELEDVKNSQASVLKKIVQIEADNINLNIDILDLADIHEQADNSLENLDRLIEEIQTYRDDFVEKHKLDLVEQA
jgi:hypothetical protein